MKPIRFALATLAVCLATSAVAVPTTGTYTFTGTPAAGSSTWNSAKSGWNATNGTNYGNSLTFNARGITNAVTATAWASTGGSGHYTGTLEQGFVSRYAYSGSTLNELAITSQPGTGNTSELTGSGNTRNPNSGDNEHAIDNMGSYEAMMFSFASAVQLNSVSVGFPSGSSSIDADATVLVYTGTGCSPSPCATDPTSGLTARTFQDLLSNGWNIAGNLQNLQSQPGGTGSLSASVASSKYWMVGAYMSIGANATNGSNDGTKDYFKIDGLSVTQGAVTPRVVPEPDSLALSGIAATALFASRRRSKRRA
ncbi:MAG: exosortase-dependent surface protein XDP1 [Burkholderiaceae bacterium]